MSGKTRKFFSFLLAFVFILTNVFSFGEAPLSHAAQKTKLKTKSISVTVKKKKKIVFKKKLKNYKYSFKSKNKNIASVSKKGVVTGKKVGKTTIIVTEKKKNMKKQKAKTVGKVKVRVNAAKTPDVPSIASGTPVPANVLPTASAGTPSGGTSTNTPNVPSTPAPDTPTTAPVKGTPNPNGTTTSVKVYMDEIKDANLLAEVKGPGTVPTPTPEGPVETLPPTPEPTPQVIFDVDFENGKEAPFTDRNATVGIANDGAGDSSKCLSVTGRTSSWNGTQIDITEVAETGKEYEITFWAKQTTGSKLKIDASFQITDATGNAAYPSAGDAELESDTWTEVTLKTEIPDHVGAISLYWQIPSDAAADFYLDNFKMTGVPRAHVDIPDLSAGLIKTSVGNPIVTSRLTADPYAMEYNGRIYVYGTNDSQQYELAGAKDNNYSKITTINCYSSADMVNWTDHGAIAVAGSKGAAKWASNSWAPAAAHKTINGKEKFFLYFADNGSGIGVLTADSPTGPWTDPIGKQLIDRNTPNCEANKVGWLFDPAVLVDDDGTGYLYFGGIGDTSGKSDDFIKNPKCARVIKLGDDMISTVGEAQVIDAPYTFEDSGINKINGKYYYSYCTNWTEMDGRDVPIANIAVMESDDPMSGFTYVGTVLQNPGEYFHAYGNNHHCFAEFKGKYYAFYHNKKDTTALGTKADYRTTYVDELDLGENGNFTNKDGKVADTPMTVAGVPAVDVVDPYHTIEAETFSMANKMATQANALASSNPLWNSANLSLLNGEIGSYVGVSNVDFGSGGAGSINLKMSSATDIDYQDYPTDLLKRVTGKHTIYFVFEKENVLVDSWMFYKD